MTFRNLLSLAVILVLMTFVFTACSGDGGAGEKKATDDKTAQTSETATGSTADEGATTEQPMETTDGVVTSVTEDGNTSVASDGSKAVTDESGATTIVDAQGQIISAQGAEGATQSHTGVSPAAMGSGAGKIPANRGEVDIKDKVAIMKTNMGDVYFFFYPEIAPNHVRNFIYLAQKGFFKNVPFHRIVRGFMAQGGQPRSDWTEEVPPLRLEVKPGTEAIHRPGALSAARTNDPNSATSQFFLVFTREKAKHLDNQYTVYGQMFKGFETLTKLENVKTGPSDMMQGEVSKPMQDVHIIDVVIEDAAKYQKEIDEWKEKNKAVM